LLPCSRWQEEEEEERFSGIYLHRIDVITGSFPFRGRAFCTRYNRLASNTASRFKRIRQYLTNSVSGRVSESEDSLCIQDNAREPVKSCMSIGLVFR
jgi:hypothetical protein